MLITIDLSDTKVREIVESLLCSAFEGGSNAWYRIDGYTYPEGKTRKTMEAEKRKVNEKSKFESDKEFYPHIDTVFMGGGIKVRDMESANKGLVTLTYGMCQNALKLMAECATMLADKRHTHPRHWENVMSENTDAETGDVFLQLALWSEVIYG